MRNRLVCRVFAGNMTATALDAQVLINDGFFDVIEIQELPVGDTGYRFAHELLQRELLFIEKVAQTIDEIVNDLESVHHGCRADLNIAGAECQKVDGIAPVGNSAHA